VFYKEKKNLVRVIGSVRDLIYKGIYINQVLENRIFINIYSLTLAISLSNETVVGCPKSPPIVTFNDENNSCNFFCNPSVFLSLASRSSICVLKKNKSIINQRRLCLIFT